MPADRPISDAIESLTARLSEALAAVLPDGADWRARLTPIVEATVARFELVPRQDFERELNNIERLRRDIAALEARISALEPSERH
jgi:BMFP domain-containing protein YqiC